MFFCSLITSSALLSVLSLAHFFVYGFVVFIMMLMGREMAKLLEHPTHGSVVLGVYFGVWLSFPIGAYSFIN